MKNPTIARKVGNSRKDKKYPKISVALTGRILSSEHKAALKIAQNLPGVKVKKSAATKGVPKSVEACANMSAAQKKYFAEHPEAHTGENAPGYIDGRSKLPYDQDWTEEFRENKRREDNYTCQLCGKTEAQEIAEFGQVLSVHHCRYGKITKDDIFVALCCRCNKKVDKKSEKDYWTKFFVARMILAA